MATATVTKTAKKMTTAERNAAIHAKAHKAGTEAMESSSLEHGGCGFAWIKVVPGTSSFARWAKKEGVGRSTAVGSGVNIWVRHRTQSEDRKFAYAAAYAAVLNEEGIRAYPESRTD